MSAITFGQNYTGAIEVTEDNWGITKNSDDYSFTASVGHIYQFDIKSTSTYKDENGILRFNDISFKVLDSNGDEVDKSSIVIDKTIDGTTTVKFLAQTAGEFTLNVNGYAGFSTDEFGQVDRVESPYTLTTTDLGVKDEVADTKANATELTVGANATESNIYDSQNDKDYFKFAADATKDYAVTVTFADGTYKRINIDSEDYRNTHSGQDSDTKEQYYFTPSAADITDGYATFAVTGGKGDYSVKVEEIVLDADPNSPENFTRTLDLTNGTATLDSNIFSRLDDDYFKIENVNANSFYKLVISTEEDTPALDSWWEDMDILMFGASTTNGIYSNGRMNWDGYLSSVKETETSKEYFIKTGNSSDYYLGLYAFFDATGDYTVTFSEVTDENDAKEDATTLTVNDTARNISNDWDHVDETVYGVTTRDDFDYFKVDLVAGETYMIKTIVSGGENLSIIDPDGTTLKERSDYNIKDGYMVNLTAEKDGTYYIQKSYEKYSFYDDWQWWQDGAKAYDISVRNIDTSDVDFADSSKDGNSLENAYTIDKQTTYIAGLDASDDQDWFKVKLYAGQKYKVATDSHQIKYMKTDMKNSDGSQLVSDSGFMKSLKNGFEAIHKAGGENLQKTIDFISNMSVDEYLEIATKLKSAQYYQVGSTDREKFLMYSKLFANIDRNVADFDIDVRLQDTANGDKSVYLSGYSSYDYSWGETYDRDDLVGTDDEKYGDDKVEELQLTKFKIGDITGDDTLSNISASDFSQSATRVLGELKSMTEELSKKITLSEDALNENIVKVAPIVYEEPTTYFTQEEYNTFYSNMQTLKDSINDAVPSSGYSWNTKSASEITAILNAIPNDFTGKGYMEIKGYYSQISDLWWDMYMLPSGDEKNTIQALKDTKYSDIRAQITTDLVSGVMDKLVTDGTNDPSFFDILESFSIANEIRWDKWGFAYNARSAFDSNKVSDAINFAKDSLSAQNIKDELQIIADKTYANNNGDHTNEVIESMIEDIWSMNAFKDWTTMYYLGISYSDRYAIKNLVSETQKAIANQWSEADLEAIYTMYNVDLSTKSADELSQMNFVMGLAKDDILITYNPANAQPDNTDMQAYTDEYQEILDLGISLDDFNDIVAQSYGGDVSTYDNEDIFTISETGYYYIQASNKYSFYDTQGSYNIKVSEITNNDAGDTIGSAADFVQLDINDSTEEISDEDGQDGVIEGVISTKDDIDFYKIDLKANNLYSITANECCLDMKFYDADGNRVLEQYGKRDNLNKNWSSWQTDYSFRPDADGTYYIALSDHYFYSASNYKLSIQNLSANEDIVDLASDTAKGAEKLIDATDDSFSLDYKNDTDLFKIETDIGKNYVITLDSDDMKYANLKIVYLDEDGNEREVYSNSLIKDYYGIHFEDLNESYAYTKRNWDSDKDIELNLFATGTEYYIKVDNYAETGDYTLTFDEDTSADDYGSNENDQGVYDDITKDSDGFVNASFEKRNDADWFEYNFEKGVYKLVFNSEGVDGLDVDFMWTYNGEAKSMQKYYSVVEDFATNKADTTGNTKTYIIKSNYAWNSGDSLQLKNSYGAGDYKFKIEKVGKVNETATTITFDNKTYSNSDELEFASDMSKYEVVLEAKKVYEITLNATGDDAESIHQFKVTIKDSDGKIVDTIDREWNPSDVMDRFAVTATSNDTYTIEVESTSKIGQGAFTFNMTELDVSNDIGSTINTSSSFISLDTDFDGTITSEIDPSYDKDWIKYDFVGGKQYLISVDADNNTGLVFIYNSEGKLVKTNQIWNNKNFFGNNADKDILFNPTTDGTYYMVVANGAASEYDLTVDEYTDNNDISNAIHDDIDIEVDTSCTVDLANLNQTSDTRSENAVKSIIDNVNDKDWLKVEFEAGNIYKIDTKVVSTANKLDLAISGIYDANGNYITGTSDNDGTTFFKAETTGDYYVEVYSKNNTIGIYDTTIYECSAEDAILANANTKAVTSVNEIYDGKVDYFYDKDWIRVELEEGKTYDINMSGKSGLDTQILGVYDTFGNRIVNSGNNDANRYTLDSLVTVTAEETGTYFIEAAGFGDSVGRYTLDVKEHDENASEIADETIDSDENDDYTTAITGNKVNSYVSGAINYDDDYDVYEYELEAGVTYEISMFGKSSKLGSLTDTFISSVLDSDGNEIAGTSNARGGFGNDSLVTFTAETSGKYYIETSSLYGSVGSFKLQVKEQGDNLGGVTAKGDGSHTLMFYIAGDNNLESDAVLKLIQMQLGELPEGWTATFLIDRADGYYEGQGDWTDTRQGIITHSENRTEITSSMESLGELNTGDGQTLTDFINWSTKMAEADQYSLVLYDHGGGLVGSLSDDKLGEDQYGHDIIGINEMTNAIKSTELHQAREAAATQDDNSIDWTAEDANGKAFESIIFATCLQGLLEQQYALKDVTDVVVASEEVSWTGQLTWEDVFDDINDKVTLENDRKDAGQTGADADGLLSGIDIGRIFMDNYDGSSKDLTYSSVETDKLQDVVDSVATLNNLMEDISASDKQRIDDGADSVVTFQGSQIDLGAFAQMVNDLNISSEINIAAAEVVANVNLAVDYNKTNMTGNGGDATGIALYYNGGHANDSYLNNFEIAQDMNMQAFFDVV
jgi:hypothetical protein